jgi:esterase FrsA
MEPKSHSLEEVMMDIVRRVGRVNPFEWTRREEVEGVVGHLRSLDPDLWATDWGKLGQRYEALGEEQEKQRQIEEAGRSYYQAYEYYRVGRYPVPSSPQKMNCYKAGLRSFLRAAPYLDPPLERVEIPFEGKKVVGYLQIPKGSVRPPVVMHWGCGWMEGRPQIEQRNLAQGRPSYIHGRHAGRG